MAQSTSASDSETPTSPPQVPGLAQIALGAAAGAFIASRMSRGALLLTAGLAYTLWSKVQKTAADSGNSAQHPATASEDVKGTAEVLPDKVLAPAALIEQEQPEPPVASLPEAPVPSAPSLGPVMPAAHLVPFLSFPVIAEPEPIIPPEVTVDMAQESSPPAEEEPETTAWEELRAALMPTYPSTQPQGDFDSSAAFEPPTVVLPQHLMPSFAIAAPPREAVTLPDTPLAETPLFAESQEAKPLLEAPPMVDLAVCQPSSPLIHTPITEGVDIPDVIQLPEPAEENALADDEDFILDQPSVIEPVGLSNLPTKPITVIVPRQDIKFTPPTTSLPMPDEMPPNSLSAPVVIPRDLQAKKSFFDWLRG